MEDFYDNYQNLTLKSGFLLKNFLLYFQNSKYLLKIDDDVYLNHIELRKILFEQKSTADIIGQVSKTRSVHRDRESKWYMPHWLYNENEFPLFINGPAVAIKGE